MGKRVGIVIDRAQRTIYLEKQRMGEVRVKVKLTNAFDEALSRLKKLPAAKVRTVIAEAMVDTGAVRTVIPAGILKKLGVKTRTTRVVEYADGRTESVPVSEAVIIEVEGRDTTEEVLVLGNEVLIGQTVLETTDLFVDCAGRRLIPNPEHPDQAVIKVK
jgi:clan AA aspartic protease